MQFLWVICNYSASLLSLFFDELIFDQFSAVKIRRVAFGHLFSHTYLLVVVGVGQTWQRGGECGQSDVPTEGVTDQLAKQEIQ